MGYPLDIMFVAPRRSASMPSVVMKEGSPMRVTMKPLMAPIPKPITIMTAAAMAGFNPRLSFW